MFIYIHIYIYIYIYIKYYANIFVSYITAFDMDWHKRLCRVYQKLDQWYSSVKLDYTNIRSWYQFSLTNCLQKNNSKLRTKLFTKPTDY